MFKKAWLGCAALTLLSPCAFGADLPSGRVSPYVPMPVFSWSGLYIGATVGGVGIKTADQLTGLGGFGGGVGFSRLVSNGGGVLGGGTAGYNYQIGHYLLGIEGDFSYSTAGNSGTGGATAGGAQIIGQSTSLSSFGTARARLGYAMDRVLLYATGGLAFGKITSSGLNSFIGVPGAFATTSQFKTGYVAGAGIEYAITNNVSVKVEGLYADLGTQSASDTTGGTQFYRTTELIARAGVNYKFDLGLAAPVVARY